MNLNPAKAPPWIFLILWLMHTLGLIAAVFLLYGKPLDANLGELSYHLNDLVKNLREGEGYRAIDQLDLTYHAHRMPAVPYFLAGLTSLTTNFYFTYFLKILLATGLLWISFFTFASHVTLKAPWVIIGILFIIGFPQIQLQLTMLETEEGYLIPLFALTTALLLSPRADETRYGMREFAIIAMPALLYLTKSSLFPFSIFMLLPIMFRYGKGVSACAATVLLFSVMAWGFHTASYGGSFRTGTSLDGWNLYKGNNELTTTVYPNGTLDSIEDLIVPEVLPESEWEFDAYFKESAVEYIKENPGQTAWHFSLKFWNLFINSWNPPMGDGQIRYAIAWVGFLFMVSFRLISLATVAWCFFVIIKSASKGKWSDFRSPGVAVPLYFICLASLYSAPYLVGFAYERHAIPMIVPTVFVGLWLLIGGEKEEIADEGSPEDSI